MFRYRFMVGVIATSAVIISLPFIISNPNTALGEEIVRLMYEFDEPIDLYKQYEILKNIVSEEVYSNISLNNVTRFSSAYYKFKGEQSNVNILDSKDGFVMYSIDCESIDPSRVFLLYYEYDNNTITSMREYELDSMEVVTFA